MSRRIVYLGPTVLVAAAVVALLGVATKMLFAPSGEVVWKADASQPIENEWASVCVQDQQLQETYAGMTSTRFGQAADPSSPSPTGRLYWTKIRASDDCGDGERAELGQGNPTKFSMLDRLFREGEERWVSWAVRPRAIDLDGCGCSPDWWGYQWKQTNISGFSSTQPPIVGFDMVNGQWGLSQQDETTASSISRRILRFGPIVPGRWVRFTVHVKFSQFDNVGFLEMFGDLGEGLGWRTLAPKLMGGTLKRNPADGSSVPSHARIGIYRAPGYSDTGRVDYAGFTVATSRGLAEQEAFGG